MQKVSGSRPDGVQEENKKNSARSLGNMQEKKGKMRYGSREEARDVAREGAQSNPLLFIR